MKIVLTGNRPQKLGGFKAYTLHSRIKKALEKLIKEMNPGVVYLGMALGTDQWGAEICIKNNIPFVAAVPFKKQPEAWPQSSQNHYRYLLKKAESVVYVDRQPGYLNTPLDEYKRAKMHVRNNWMINQINPKEDAIIVVATKANFHTSGTYNCLQYARSKSVRGLLIDVDFLDKGKKLIMAPSVQTGPVISTDILFNQATFVEPQVSVMNNVTFSDDLPF